MISLSQANEIRSAKRHKTETLKDSFNASEAWDRLIGYSKSGYASISEDDKDFILKSFGIFDRPATPERFMIRVRIAGGALNVEQAMVLGNVAKDYGQDYIDITTRQQVELRYMRIEDIPDALSRLESVGLTSHQTGVDNFRNILIDPLDGLAMDNIIECISILESIQAVFLKNEEWITRLPRKFNIGINGSLSNRCNIFGQDFALSLAQKDGEYGFNLYLGGRVGTLAESADMFVLPHQALEVFTAVVTLFKTYGFRDNRNKNRLVYLIEAVGMETFRSAIEEQLGFSMPREGENLTQMEGGDHYGKIALKNGNFALYAAVPSGVFSGSDMILAAEMAKSQNGAIRLSIEQNLIITGITNVENALKSPLFEKYPNRPSPYMANLIACAGTEHCPFGVIPNKPDAIEMGEYLAHQVPIEDAKIRLYWSACIKGCGVHGAGDLGFLGCKTKHNGETKLGVDIFIGGSLTNTGGEGHLLLKGIVLEHAKEYVAELMRIYKDLRNSHESLERFIHRIQIRYSNYAIGFMMRWNRLMQHKSLSAKLNLSMKSNGGSHRENDEIYTYGLDLVYAITGERAYDVAEPFLEGRRGFRFDIKATDPSYQPYLSIIEKMVAPNPQERYEVFTEIVTDLSTLDPSL